jgi:carboxymethylenebutenolidase
MPHVNAATWTGMSADIAAGAAHARALGPDRAASLFTIGFCFGGRAAFLSATLGLGLAGAIGFYGSPVGPGRGGAPAPADVADRVEGPILGLFGGADAGIPPEAIAAFDAALDHAGVEQRLITYPNAPHSFFDRKAAEFKAESEEAWVEVLAFIRARA